MKDSKEGIEEKKQHINSLGIYELRGLARALGIKSPTTKLRSQLIDEILTALSTGIVAEPHASRKGRPHKQLANLGDILSFVSDESLENSEQFADLHQEIAPFSLKSSTLEKMSGVLRKSKKPAYFFDTKTYCKVYVSEQLLQNLNVCDGDYLSVEAYKINDGAHYSASKILSINNISASKYALTETQLSKKTFPSQFLHLEGGQILLGGRNYLFTTHPLFMDNDLKNFLNFLEKQNAVNIFVGMNMCYEDRCYIFGCKNFINFTTSYLNSNVDENQVVMDAINLITRLNKLNVNVNLVIYDVATLINVLSKNAEEKGDELEENKLYKRLIALAGAYESEVCTTVIATCDESDKQAQVIKQDVLKIANNIKD